MSGWLTDCEYLNLLYFTLWAVQTSNNKESCKTSIQKKKEKKFFLNDWPDWAIHSSSAVHFPSRYSCLLFVLLNNLLFVFAPCFCLSSPPITVSALLLFYWITSSFYLSPFVCHLHHPLWLTPHLPWCFHLPLKSTSWFSVFSLFLWWWFPILVSKIIVSFDLHFCSCLGSTCCFESCSVS